MPMHCVSACTHACAACPLSEREKERQRERGREGEGERERLREKERERERERERARERERERERERATTDRPRENARERASERERERERASERERESEGGGEGCPPRAAFDAVRLVGAEVAAGLGDEVEHLELRGIKISNSQYDESVIATSIVLQFVQHAVGA